MTTSNIDNLVNQITDKACTIAIKAAGVILNKEGNASDIDYALLSDLLKEECKADIESAFDDAVEAIKAGVTDWASVTFASTMRQAGNRAARRYIACLS